MKICGVDPGKEGGIVVLDRGVVVFKEPMPVYKSTKTKMEYDIHKIVDIFKFWKPDVTFLEKAILHPRSGKSAYFSNGFCNGVFQGILASLSLPYEIINAPQWQKAIFKGMQKKDTKQMSIMFCRRRFPAEDWRKSPTSSKYHDGMCDAACIALYGTNRG